MDNKLLLDIIDKEINELKLLTLDFRINEPSPKDIEIVIHKAEVLLKELSLLSENKPKKSKESLVDIMRKALEKDSKDVISDEKADDDVQVLVKDEIKSYKPTQDIRKFIGINDKFLFIRELFKGDTRRYDTYIDELNKINSFIEAENLLSREKWDNKEESTKLFLEIVNRKFS